MKSQTLRPTADITQKTPVKIMGLRAIMDENLHVGDVCVFAPILAISMRSDAFEKAFFHIFHLATQNHIYKIAMAHV